MVRSSVGVLLGAAMAVLVLGAAGPAHAGGYSVHVLGNVRTGWTDNIQSAEDSPTAAPAKEADFYSQVIPGVLVTHELQRMTQELFYEAEGSFYVEHSEAWSINHRAGWRAFFLTSPESEVGTSVTVASGTLNTFNTSSFAQNGQLVLQPSAESKVNSIEARELYTRQVSRPLRINQSAVARMFSVSAEGASSTGYELGGGAGVDRGWEWDALGANATASYYILGAGTVDSVNQIAGSLTATWRRDLTAAWSTLVDAGATALIPLEEGEENVIGPTAGAAVNYLPEWGSASLSLRRSIQPNIQIQANTVNDLAMANLFLPLPILRDRLNQPRLVVGATAGAGRTTVYSPATGEELSGFTVALADVALDYRIGEQMSTSLRYQYQRQDVDEDALGTMANVHGYVRNTVLLTFYMRWPERAAAEVPRRAGVRVDRSDVTPAGEEIDPQGSTPGETSPRRP